MLRVRAEVRPSPIHGLGLFALERIPRGTVVWSFDAGVDQLSSSPAPHGYSFRTEHGHIIPGDDAKFINHSATPNLETTPGLTPAVAVRDIEVGEELTEDYAYDPDWTG